MRSHLLYLTLLALLAGTPALAGEHDHGKSDGKGHGRAFCPHCGEACYPTVTKGKETKVCFESEVKTICIPKVRFPWDGAGLNLSFGNGHGKGKGKGKSGCGDCGGKSGCGGKDGACLATKCGRTKDVNVLLKHEYECSVCKYSWDPGGFKDNGSKKDGKYLEPPSAEVDEPGVPAPPSVEARRTTPRGTIQPVRYTEARSESSSVQGGTESRARESFFARFFR